MDFFKQMLVIALLTLFAAGTTTSIAMAYCGDAHSARDGQSTEESIDASTPQPHEAMEHGGHGGAEPANSCSSNADGDTSGHYECDGSLCNSHSLAPIHFALGLYVSASTLHIEKGINPTQVFLAKIPQPPKQLS